MPHYAALYLVSAAVDVNRVVGDQERPKATFKRLRLEEAEDGLCDAWVAEEGEKEGDVCHDVGPLQLGAAGEERDGEQDGDHDERPDGPHNKQVKEAVLKATLKGDDRDEIKVDDGERREQRLEGDWPFDVKDALQAL